MHEKIFTGPGLDPNDQWLNDDHLANWAICSVITKTFNSKLILNNSSKIYTYCMKIKPMCGPSLVAATTVA